MSLTSRIILLCIALLIKPGYAQDPFAGDAGSPFGSADDKPFLPVTEAYRVLPALEGERLELQWSIADGYYLYRDRFAVEARLDNTTLKVNPQFEPGEEKDDPYFGRTTVYYNNTVLTLTGLPENVAFDLRVTAQGCADAGLCYPPHDWFFRVDTGTGAITPLSAADWPAADAAGERPPERERPSLLPMLLLAAMGGIILNLMPCVFPVLSLKVLAFANSRDGRPLSHGAVYSLGVVASFAAVAGVLIALQGAGRAVGWGFQLQSPWFVASLSCLFFLLSLNLLGVFQIAGSWLNLGGELTARGGHSGSFFTGVLATVVATPCTAPFMGTAVGFAAAQPAAVALLVFTALGAGMALPVLLLTLFPGWLRWLPRPGAWMVRLRQFLAFPLLASALWLAWVIGRQTGATGMAITVGLWLVIGFLLWLWSQGFRGRVVAVVTALLTAGWLLQSQPYQQQAERPVEAGHVVYTPERLAQYRRAGKPVFLNVTADWCITCAANEALVLNKDRTKTALAEAGVIYMVADWTRYDPAITELLAEYDRNGIPLYLLFPGDPTARARVLPQVLTGDTLRRALEEL